MFVQNSYTKGDAVTLVLDNSMEIVGRFVEENETKIKLGAPRMVQVQMAPNGGAQLALQPLAFTADEVDEVEFDKSKLLFHKKSNEDIDKKLRSDDSGIEIANSMPGR